MFKTYLLDKVSDFSPGREEWVARERKNLPEKVTVRFETGTSAFLDLRAPLGIHWADVMNRSANAGQPVYVEIDDESGVVLNLLIPWIFTIQSLTPDDRGDVIVRLMPSSAIHFLLKSNPSFDTILADLQKALDNGLEVLITETRDHHEIIDVRPPLNRTPMPTSPGGSPPDDPPVSEARAQELFTNMNGQSCDPCNPSLECIPFLFPDDGCWIRAHIMCHLMRTGGPNPVTNPPEDPEKIWIEFGDLQKVSTSNHPDCSVCWGWHVAPTILTSLPGGDEKRVIDPSLCPSPVSIADWKNLQNPAATLTEAPWTDYGVYGDGKGSSVNLVQAQHEPFLQKCRDDLKTRCLQYGPPPYSCTKNGYFIIDRNTFSDYEIQAMLNLSSPAVIPDAFYIVVDGFSPHELGFTDATMQITPQLGENPDLPGMTITAERLEFDDPVHLNRRQRLTWVYSVTFINISDFTAAGIQVTLTASVGTVSATGYLYLVKQPNPYETDGATSWLSTDLRVFQIRSGEQMFGVPMGTDPGAFITQVISNLNNPIAGGMTFEDGIPTDPQVSRLELSQTVQGTAVYNFAIAKVRYRSLTTPATDVRVFFRLFPAATTSVAYDPAETYRRFEQTGNIIPLLGIDTNNIVAIPCFAAPRIDSSVVSMTSQTDPANVQTIPSDTSGNEVARYFGCWLDINQTQPQFPLHPSPSDGPFPANRVSIQDLIRNEHQCLVSEIVSPTIHIQDGASPSTSDKLAQRNLAIVQSANPGIVSSRRIPQTFEIRPSSTDREPDELMIDWGNLPGGSHATIYLPDFDTDEILKLALQTSKSHRFVRIDSHTLRCEAGGITYLPIPFSRGSFPGMITVDLPEGVTKGEVYTLVVRQVTGITKHEGMPSRTAYTRPVLRHIVGSFQVTIPVENKGAILSHEERLLSNLRWIKLSIPENDRWARVFQRYVTQVADRVDAFGGHSETIEASPSDGKSTDPRCRIYYPIISLLTALSAVCIGIPKAGFAVTVGIPLVVLLVVGLLYWIRACRVGVCLILKAVMTGTALGTVVLAILILLGMVGVQTQGVLVASAIATVILAILIWVKRCFRIGTVSP